MKRSYKALLAVVCMLVVCVGMTGKNAPVYAVANYIEVPIELNVSNVTAMDLKIELNTAYIKEVKIVDRAKELNNAIIESNIKGSTMAVAIASSKKIDSITRPFTLRFEVTEDANETTELCKLKHVSVNEKVTMTAENSILISGVRDGGTYDTEGVQIFFNQGSATLNGSYFQTGNWVSQKGMYSLIITDSKGKSRTVTFKIADDHVYSDWFTTDKSPTCTEDGEKSRHCTKHSNCNDRTEVTRIPATGHTKSDWITDKYPTYEAQGSRYQYCTKCGEVVARETIAKLPTTSITKVSINGIQTKTYNGKAQTLSLKLTYASRQLAEGTDYWISYQNNVNPGTATVTINGMGAFTGQVKKSFTIQLPKMGKLTYKSTETTVTLTWTSLSGMSGYVVERYDSSKKKFVAIKKVTKATYKDTKLKNGTEYRYRIRPYVTINKKDQYGTYSSTLVTGTIPTVPSSFKAVAAKGKKINLSWKRGTGADGYEIYSSNKQSGTYKKVTTITKGKTTSYSNTKLKAGSTYYYKVRSYKKVNGKTIYSTWSKTVKAKAIK